MDAHNCEALLDLFLLETLRIHGYAKFTRPGLNMLRGAAQAYLTALALKLKYLAELNQRSDVSVVDLLQLLQANEYDIDGLVEFVQQSRPAPNSLRRQVTEVIDVLTDAEESIARVGEAEVLRESDAKTLTLRASTPMAFVRIAKDIEKRFVLLGPDRAQMAHTPVMPTLQVTRREMKDARIEERRVFELETCKLRAFDQKSSDAQPVGTVSVPDRDNPLGQEAQAVESLNEFDVVNSQMFS